MENTTQAISPEEHYCKEINYKMAFVTVKQRNASYTLLAIIYCSTVALNKSV